MKNINEINIKFPGKSCNEAFARVAVAAFAAQLDPTLDEMSDIKTAVSEAVTNCIVHAYRGKIGAVYISAAIAEGGLLRIKVRDTGVGIPDIALAMQPMYTSAPGDERAGLGFALMQTFMDKIKVRSTPGKGTSVSMEKKIKPRD
ncbi:MAG: anti-sigma F factor [Oscillospiraceae bacterium]|jgi:stage II sporulation protein AB (anti-sigma F factor)|nr:anti-sigma F factor [Oscillospiraceae bacterium]